MEDRNQFLDVLQKISMARKYLSGWHQNVAKWRKLYDLAHYSRPANKREIQYSDPTFTNTVDLAVGIMLANQLRWHSYGFVPTKTEQSDTGQIEKLLDGVLHANNEREERFQQFELYQNFVRDGGGVIYSVFDPEVMDRSKSQSEVPIPGGTKTIWKLNEVPIYTRVIDPMNFFALPGGPKRWLMMGRVESMSVLDVEILYDVRIEKFAHLSDFDKSVTRGEFIDAWDWVSVSTPVLDGDGNPVMNTLLGKPETYKSMGIRNTVIFENQPLRGPMIMQGYTDLPYSVQFYKPTGTEPEKWQSILSTLEDTVNLLERSFNRRAYQIDVYTGLPLVTKVQPGRKVSIDPGLYNSISISPDESIEFPTWPGNAPDLERHMEFLRGRIQQSGFSDVMFGQGSGEAAGYAMAQLGDQNRIRLEQPIKHLELLFTTWAKKTLKQLDKFASGVSLCVYGNQRGLDFQDYVDINNLQGYQIRAEIRPSYPNEEQRNVAMATQVKGILSNYKIMERFLHEEQPEDEEKRIFMEKVTNHPATIQYAVLKELKKRADSGDEVAAMTIQTMQSGGSLGEKPGPDPAGNNPEQLTGLQSPNGQPVPQAVGGDAYGTSPTDVQNDLANQAPKLMR